MPWITCPICSQPFETELSTAAPFCSDRCRQIDLGRWMKEEYGLPIERAEEPSHETQVEE
ncbi:MAG: DNA gyrase inhibitor YacG [Planctomycetales bacterium]|nr:DNA gyrase inhibitor YacG [Planctomycetales bacterium]NIM10162.1 DNA gyrase inhibitor YacG [Planctomycetales bacterium]NIN09588.1 DNA gyrase inhibitor YacG [Planctomycetales bacterium]NIN78711.1 DNA gyrase inhibitor YacG [Planctomycetales bacterium]NIO35888.1 DNA gyrase inhibitor YacG [Planctomycetales bacterium]